jgi:acyl-CoA thioesterase
MPGDKDEIRADARGHDEVAAFNRSEYARLLGISITDARDGYARVVMECPGKCNTDKVAHGGAIFSLADQAFGIAANCAGVHRVAISVHIQYIAPATSSLIAIAERVANNGSCDTYKVMVYQGERIVAEFEGVAFRVTE